MFTQSEVSQLLNAVQRRKLADCQQLVLKAGKDIIVADNGAGEIALQCAAAYDHHEIVDYFLRQHIDCNTLNKFGHTALMKATLNGSITSASLLLKAGAHVDIADQHGKTALIYARERGHKDLLALLEAYRPKTQPTKPVALAMPQLPQRQMPDLDSVLAQLTAEQNKRLEAEQNLQQLSLEHQSARAQLDQMQQSHAQKDTALAQERQEHQVTKASLAQKDAELQATKAELKATQTTLAAVSLELTQLRTASTDTQLQQTAQGLVGTGHRLTLDDICVLVQFWNLDIKLDALRASTLTLQDILDLKPVTLKRRLGCNYGTAVALVSFLRKLADGGVLAPARTGCTDQLDSALQAANCLALKPLFLRQGVADDVLLEIDFELLASLESEIADCVVALRQGLRAGGIGLLIPLEPGAILLSTE
eukprot:m.591230 g.591230  ORF g.591230 m.591230 type:complete len:422 (+) comp58013_c0_seq45:89-1354(+)